MTSPFSTPQTWTSTTGAKLCVRHLPAAGEHENPKGYKGPKGPKGIVQITHGLAEHSARYERFATALSAAGYHAYAHDHRGHGYTTSPDAPQGVFSNRDGFEKALTDMHFVNSEIRKAHPGMPVILFGHSMGGILGTNYCIRHSDTVAGAALWNFNVDGGVLISILTGLLKIERALKGSDVPSLLATKMTFEDWNRKFKPNRTDFDWLSRDEAEVDKYVADPLCGFPASVGLWLDLMKAIQTASRNSELGKIRNELPINLIGGEADPSSSRGKSMLRLAARMKTVGISDLTVRVLPDTRHETLNEINRDEETEALIAWLDERWG